MGSLFRRSATVTGVGFLGRDNSRERQRQIRVYADVALVSSFFPTLRQAVWRAGYVVVVGAGIYLDGLYVTDGAARVGFTLPFAVGFLIGFGGSSVIFDCLFRCYSRSSRGLAWAASATGGVAAGGLSYELWRLIDLLRPAAAWPAYVAAAVATIFIALCLRLSMPRPAVTQDR